MVQTIRIDGLNREESDAAFKRMLYMVTDINSQYLYEREQGVASVPFAKEAWGRVVFYRGYFLSKILPGLNSLMPREKVMASAYWLDHEGSHLEILVEESQLTLPVIDRMRNEVRYLLPKTQVLETKSD
jgi:hypothetical protein